MNPPRKCVRKYDSVDDLPTNIADDTIANVNGEWYRKLSGVWTLVTVGTFGDTGSGSAAALLTVSGGGAIVRSQMIHKVAGAGGIADDLDTVTGAEVEGKLTLLRPSSDTVDITVKHGTGNIECPDSQDIVLAEDDDCVLLLGNGTKAAVVAFKTKGAWKKAAKVSILDTAGLITATDVEGALAELALFKPGAIADPGASGAVPVTKSGYVPLVSAGAETRTIAAPTFIGQRLLVYLKTDGGDVTVTVATFVNQAGNNTVTLDDIGDAFELVCKESAGNKCWSLVFKDGVTLTTV